MSLWETLQIQTITPTTAHVSFHPLFLLLCSILGQLILLPPKVWESFVYCPHSGICFPGFTLLNTVATVTYRAPMQLPQYSHSHWGRLPFCSNCCFVKVGLLSTIVTTSFTTLMASGVCKMLFNKLTKKKKEYLSSSLSHNTRAMLFGAHPLPAKHLTVGLLIILFWFLFFPAAHPSISLHMSLNTRPKQVWTRKQIKPRPTSEMLFFNN